VQGSLVGSLEGTTIGEQVKMEAARTIPPREQGGNCDIKNLSRGSKVWLPIFVEGANLSVGDLRFSQGDGEIAFCGGIEMAGAVTLKTRVIKDGVGLYALRNPIFIPGPVEPRYHRMITFQGISVDNAGKQHYLDVSLSFKQATLNCLNYFKKFGYTKEQIYLLLSAAPCEARINNIVDVPNACCSIGVPVEIFDFDVLPTAWGHECVPKGQVAMVKEVAEK
jgi:formamidase